MTLFLLLGQGMAISRILELLSHKEIFPEILVQLHFIAENCQRLATVLTSLEESRTPLGCTVYNTLEDLSAYLQAGITKTTYGSKTDHYLQKLTTSAQRKAIKCFQEVFKQSLEKLNRHLSTLPAYSIYKRIRVFDPRQLPALSHDI